MLQLSSALLSKPVMSLRTGSAVAHVTGAIFNPNNLKIEGFWCRDSMDKKELILLYQDIREVLPAGFVINDHDVLVEAEDLVRLKDIIELDYQLIGKQVVTSDKQKIGKVTDFATEVQTMMVQKIYASQSLMKSFTGGSLSIDRTQIVELTPKRIIISSLSRSSSVPVASPVA